MVVDFLGEGVMSLIRLILEIYHNNTHLISKVFYRGISRER